MRAGYLMDYYLESNKSDTKLSSQCAAHALTFNGRAHDGKMS